MSHELVIDNLQVRYGRAEAVRGVSLNARGGAVTALVGPNGAGKSSTLLGVYGSVGSTGRVTVDGEDLTNFNAARRARLGVALVPQGRQLFAHLTVRENLQVMAEMLKLGRGAITDAVDRFPILNDRIRTLAGVLSGGEQQMLVVARALMGSPRVLLLDEMMTGLAPLIVQQLARTIDDLSDQGVAVLMAEPNIAVLHRHIERGYVLVRGEVVAMEEAGGTQLDATYQRVVGVDGNTVDAGEDTALVDSGTSEVG